MARKETDSLPTGGIPPSGEPVPTPITPTTKAVVAVVALLLVGSIGTAGYFYKQLAEARKNPNKLAQDETAATIAAIGKLIVLPSDEQPTLATVSDPEKLKDQAFFAQAKQGDKVLIYTNAKQAILYSPSMNKIVAVAPVNIGDSQAQSTVSGTSTTKTPTKK